jgi:Flp pilus assembly pilin Flp
MVLLNNEWTARVNQGARRTIMKSLKAQFSRFAREESGQDLIEYGLIAMLVALIAITGVGSFGSSVNSFYVKIGGDM